MKEPLLLPLSHLRPALTGLGKIVNKRSSLAVLSHVRLRRHADGALDLTATDLDSTATCRLPGQGGGSPLTLLVPLEDLHNVARSAAGSEVIEAAPVDAETAILRFRLGGQCIEHRCGTLPPADFPEQPRCDGEAIPVPDSLRDAIGDALNCASSDATRYILNGVCLDASTPDAHYVVATDGHHLFSANSFRLPFKHSLIVPDHKFLRWRGFMEDGAWRLRAGSLPAQNAPVIELAGEHWRFVTRCIDGNYPNWRQALPDPASFTTAVRLDPEKLNSLLRVVQSLPVPAGDNHLTIGLEIKNSRLCLLGRSRTDQEWIRVRVEDAAVSGPDLTVFANRAHVLKAVRFGLARIELRDARSPLRFSLGGRQMIVMPVPPPGTGPDAAAAAPPPTAPPAATPSATTGEASSKPQPPNNPMPQSTIPKPAAPPAANARANGHAVHQKPATPEPAKPALETALEQTDQLRLGLREFLGCLSRLGDTLRQAVREQRAGDKDLQSLRQTLRSLQNVRI